MLKKLYYRKEIVDIIKHYINDSSNITEYLNNNYDLYDQDKSGKFIQYSYHISDELRFIYHSKPSKDFLWDWFSLVEKDLHQYFRVRCSFDIRYKKNKKTVSYFSSDHLKLPKNYKKIQYYFDCNERVPFHLDYRKLSATSTVRQDTVYIHLNDFNDYIDLLSDNLFDELFGLTIK